jgi:hypothetical protein
MSGFDQPSFIAELSTADILPYRIIAISAATDNTVITCTDGLIPIGVTTGATDQAAVSGVTAENALQGQPPEWLPAGRLGLVLTGEAIGVGVPVMAGTAGVAMIATTGKWVAGITVAAIASGEVGEILILPPAYYEEG